MLKAGKPETATDTKTEKPTQKWPKPKIPTPPFFFTFPYYIINNEVIFKILRKY